jgi:hypothetical protein
MHFREKTKKGENIEKAFKTRREVERKGTEKEARKGGYQACEVMKKKSLCDIPLPLFVLKFYDRPSNTKLKMN